MSKFDCKVRLHANQEIEFKLHYPVAKKARNKYGFNVYFFMPKQLNINPRTFSLNRFFRKLKTYIRYGTAELTIEKLLDPTCQISPYSQLLKLFQEAEDLNKLNVDRADYELKTYFNIANARIGEKIKAIRKAEESGRIESFALSDLAFQFFDEMKLVRENLAIIKILLYKADIDASLRKAFDWVDEGLSMTFEKSCWIISNAAELKEDDELSLYTIKILEDELGYRKSQGYANFVKANDNLASEAYIFRKQSIKKWAESIMYMSLKATKNAERVGEFLFGLAAVGAMAVSLALLFLGQSISKSKTIYFVIISLGVYMLKDRIKEALRRLSLKLVPKIVSDSEHYLYDRDSTKKCGRVKDWVYFAKDKKLPENIKKLRMHKKNRLDRLLVREDILVFHHEVIINGLELIPSHSRMSALVEINRVDLETIFSGMDKAVENVYHLEAKKLNKIKSQRVYHITAIVELVDGRIAEGDHRITRYRIVANKSGLLRIEKVASL